MRRCWSSRSAPSSTSARWADSSVRKTAPNSSASCGVLRKGCRRRTDRRDGRVPHVRKDECVMIKPWLFEFFPELGGLNVDPDPADVAAHFARYLDLWVRDEALGFEGIFFSEHHFGRSFSGSPNLLIAALAQRTKALRLGVMGIVLPYYHP